MRLIRNSTTEAVQLEDGFFWTNEFSWNQIQQSKRYAIDGSLIIEEGNKKSGRSIVLEPAKQEMGWIKLRDLRTLKAWSLLQDETFTLQFEMPHDTRTFQVIFDHEQGALEAAPVKGIPAVSLDDYFNVTVRFVELEDGD